MLTWHNETLNIWTHLLTLLAVALFCSFPWLVEDASSAVHRALFALTHVPMLACFLLSVAYHTFMARAPRAAAPIARGSQR